MGLRLENRAPADPNAPQPNSASGFLSTLIPNVVIALVFILLFLIFRTKYRRVYEPRTYLGSLKNEQRSPRTKDSKFGWISDFLKVPDVYVLNHHSLDAFLWLRFFRTCFYVFLIGTPLTWPVLMAVYGTSHGGQLQFDKISYSNINSDVDGNRLYAMVFIAWLFLGFVMVVIARESIYAVKLRQALYNLPHFGGRLSTRTVLFTNVPTDFLVEAKLRETFSSIRHVWLPTDTKDLDELVDQRDTAAYKLEGAEIKLSKTANDKRLKAEKKGGKQEANEDPMHWIGPKDRPTHRLGKFGLYGKKVDSIDWSRSQLAELSPKITTERETHLSGKAKFNSAVFIEFDTIQAAQAAYHKTSGAVPKSFVPRAIGAQPNEVIWKNLNIGDKQRRTRSMVAIAVVVALIIYFIPLTIFVGAVSNLNNIIPKAPWLGWINKLGKVKGIITGLLPVIAVTVLYILVPIIMRLLFNKVAGEATIAEVELRTQKWYFIFQVINTFLVLTLASGAISVINNILKQPGQAPTLLANGLPKASNFYINLVVLRGLGVSAGAFLQIGALIVFLVLPMLLDKTPRKKYNRYLGLSGIAWGSTFPIYTLLAAIVIIYACIAPLIVGFACIAFGFLYQAFRFNMIYSQNTLNINTHGRAYIKAVSQLSTGVYFSELCLIGLFAISSASKIAAVGPLVLMVFWLVVTILFQILTNRTIAAVEKEIALEGGAIGGKESGAVSGAAAKPVGALVKLLRIPAIPQFDAWLSTADADYEDNIRREAFLNPSIWKPTPKLWIVRDEMGISKKEVADSSKVIDITDSDAWFDEKGKVQTILSGATDKDDTNKAVQAPIWEKPVFY